LDAVEKFEVWTDHENLKYFRELHKLNGQQARWYLKLQDYDFTLRHIPGKTNMKADILSRREKVDMKEDSQDTQMLKEELWIRRTTNQDGTPIILLRQEHLQVMEEGIQEQIKKIQTREQEVTRQLEKKDGQTWKENRIIYIDGKIYVPKNRQLQDEILSDNHNPPDVGHPGQHRMMELIKRNYWWPGIHNNVQKYVQGCQECQQNKVQHMKKAAPLHPLPTPKTPWEEISIDIIGPLPKSKDKDAILVVVDQFSKMIRLMAITTSISSSEVARIYQNNIWKIHSIPKKIISNRRPQFTSTFMGELCKTLGIKKTMSTAYHPQTDGCKGTTLGLGLVT